MEICAQNPRHQLLEHLDRSFSNPFAERSLVFISFSLFPFLSFFLSFFFLSFLHPYRADAYSSFLIFAFHRVRSASILSFSLCPVQGITYVQIGASDIGENYAERGMPSFSFNLVRNEKSVCLPGRKTVRPCSSAISGTPRRASRARRIAASFSRTLTATREGTRYARYSRVLSRVAFWLSAQLFVHFNGQSRPTSVRHPCSRA